MRRETITWFNFEHYLNLKNVESRLRKVFQAIDDVTTNDDVTDDVLKEQNLTNNHKKTRLQNYSNS